MEEGIDRPVTKDDPLVMPRIGSRRWIAWKLVQLAHRIYDATYYEQIIICGPTGKPITEFTINADEYGGGVSICDGPDAFGNGHSVHWTDGPPSWLMEGA